MYSLVSTMVKSISTKLLVSFFRKVIISRSMDSFSSARDLSFLMRAKAYLARAEGSASHLGRNKAGRKECHNMKEVEEFLQRLKVGGEPSFKLLLLLDQHCVARSWYK